MTTVTPPPSPEKMSSMMTTTTTPSSSSSSRTTVDNPLIIIVSTCFLLFFLSFFSFAFIGYKIIQSTRAFGILMASLPPHGIGRWGWCCCQREKKIRKNFPSSTEEKGEEDKEGRKSGYSESGIVCSIKLNTHEIYVLSDPVQYM